MERTDQRKLSQNDVRVILKESYNIENEIFLKYVYDGYTFKGNYKAIRKPKMRKQIAIQFHNQGSSKRYAHLIIEQLLKVEG